MAKVWTEKQNEAIKADKGEILVSASAGSGKTSVMIERLVRLIVAGVDVENVLCLTFTKAASNEMKERLQKTLLSALNNERDENVKARLLNQLDRLPFSSITTIDAFCNKLVKKYFEKTELPANFVLATPEDANALKYASANAVLEKMGEKDDSEYFRLIDFLGKKRQTDSVLQILTGIYDFLYTLPNPMEYLDGVVKNYGEVVEQNPVVLYVFENAKYDIRELETCVLRASSVSTTYADEMISHLAGLKKAYRGGIKNFCEFLKIPFPEKPNFGRKEYKALDGENKEKIEILRTRTQKFQEKYQKFDILQIEKDVRELAPYIAKLVEIIKEFCAEYESRKREENLTDFAEIEQTAYKLLLDENVRAQVRERYTHVLIDEYQDTNRLQENILSLAGGTVSKFMVGDAKQSIYSFRHTEPEIFMEKRIKKDVNNILLKENFRQSKRLLNVVNSIFLSVMQEEWAGIDYSKEEMVAGLTHEDGNFPFELCFVEDEKEKSEKQEKTLYSVKENAKEQEDTVCAEGEYVYNKICELVGKEKIYDAKSTVENKERYIRFGDIVVLYRKNSEQVKKIIKYLKDKGVPVGEKGEESLPTSAEILIRFLRALANPQDDESLAIVMLSDLFGFSEEELLDYRQKSDRKKSLYYAFYSVKERFPKLKNFFQKYTEYATKAEYTDVYNLLNFVVRDTAYDKAIANREGGEREYKLLSAYLDALSNSTVAESVATYLTKFDNYPEFKTKQESGGHDSVRFMTMHGSKGLEFPVVFLVDTDKAFIKNDVKKAVIFHKKLGVVMPSFDVSTRETEENYLGFAVKDKILTENAVQELRLLYVALTRGQNKVFVSGKDVKKAEEKQDAWDATSMLDFIRIALNKNPSLYSLMKVKTFGEEEGQRMEAEEKTGEDCVQDAEKYKKELDFVYPYELSTVTPTKYTVTALTRDEYEGEEGVPVPINYPESAEVGTLYHTVMQRIDFNAKTAEDIQKELDKMVLDEVITVDEREKIEISVIEKVMNTEIIAEARENPTKREQGFLLRAKCNELKDTECEDEVLLQGVIDLLIIKDDCAVVVDYKYSGASEEQLKERYKKQLELYKKATADILGVKEVRACLLSLKTAKSVEF